MSSNLTGSLNAEDPNLAPVTRQILALRAQVISTWMANLRASVAPASQLQPPILENTLPSFYDSLAELLAEEHDLHVPGDLGALATEHGGERARLTPYDSIAVIHELQLFRDVLLSAWDTNGIQLTPHQRRMINTCIDTAVRESVNSFVAVQAALREQFIAAMTHDLRTPLSNAHMMAQLIERNSTDERVQEWARKIQENTRRMDQMTHELLDKLVFFGDNKLKLKIACFDLVELARDVVQYAQRLRPIEPALPASRVEVHWCRESMHRAIENLVSNAIKYGAPDQPIRVEVGCTERRAKVAVHNRGTPIPQEDVESIFQLYRRAAQGERTEGWGVGLPFVRKVAEAHGGSIMVSSNSADGTTFVIDVPLDARPFANAPSAA